MDCAVDRGHRFYFYLDIYSLQMVDQLLRQTFSSFKSSVSKPMTQLLHVLNTSLWHRSYMRDGGIQHSASNQKVSCKAAHAAAFKLKEILNSSALFFKALPLLDLQLLFHCLSIFILKNDIREIPIHTHHKPFPIDFG